MHIDNDLPRAGENGARRWASGVTAIGAGVAFAVSTLVLFTYVRGGYSAQAAFFPYSPAMRPNTALCVQLLSISLFMQRDRTLRSPRALPPALLSGLAAAVSFATIAEYVFSTDLGLDTLIATIPRPRMSPITALALACLSTVQLLTAMSKRATAFSQALLAISGLLSLLPIMGYLYHAPFLYNPGALTAVAPATGLSLVSLMVGSFAQAREEGLWPLLVGDTAGSTLLRRALPAVVMLPVTFGWLRLEAERLGNLGLELGVALIAVATVLTFAALLVWSARWLRDQDLGRRAATAKLNEARSTLEARVDERTHELTETEVELRRAARSLLLAKEAAEAAMRARADFLARMSHEMRTPLNGVVGMLEIALRSDLTPAQRGYVQTARSSADALLALISDVLDFSKIDAGKLLIEATTFRLRDCLALALRDNAAAAHTKGLELCLAVASDIPECLLGDAQRIRQVLTNLVSNAVKFTQHGEVRVSVSRSFRRHQEIGLLFEVKDTGVGIARDKQVEIFQAFTQADETTTRRFGGTGLGLAISAQLVSLMGGELKVDSEPGAGATFSFQLDVAIDLEAELLLDSSRASLSGKRAVLVEPSATHREYVGELLERWGIESVPSEPDAVQRTMRELGSNTVTFLLLDEARVAPLGEAYLRGLRDQLGARFPILLLTLATQLDDARELRLKHCSAQLNKPVVASELFETLVSLLAPPSKAPERERPSQDAPLHVLVVEDNEVNRRVACFLLESAGYRVAAAEDGRKALAALAERDFDAVLMDGHMPELDGIEATREIRLRERGTGRHTPIIALTAQAMKGDRERYLAAGMDGYVTKPFQSAQLLATIRDIVGRAPEPRAKAGAPVRAEPAPSAPLRTGPILPVYERDQLLSRLRGAERILRQMVQIFDEEAPTLSAALSAAVAERHVTHVQQAAHKFAGALLTVGGSRAAQVARMMENYAREGSLADADQLLARLHEEVATLARAMVDAGDLERASAQAGE